MTGIVVITHGRLSVELLETAKLIMGEQPDITAVTLGVRESIETLRAQASAAVDDYRSRLGTCLILTDLLGGSATNVCVEFLKMDGVRIITGVNLPMLMEALNHRAAMPLDELAKKARDGAMRGIIDVKEFFAERAKKKA